MDICEKIRTERSAGNTQCSVVARAMTIGEAARAFGLVDDGTIYREIQSAETDRIATRILQTSLAYGTTVMSAARATELWVKFLALFAGQPTRFVTNAAEISASFYLTSDTAFSFSSATEATFDLGVIVFGTSNTGCLWVEEED